MKSNVNKEAVTRPSLLSDIIYEHDHLIVKHISSGVMQNKRTC